MAKYIALTKTFIAPHLIEEGQPFTINDDWEPGVHVQPVDEAAEAAMEKYLEKKKAQGQDPSLHPIENAGATVSSLGEAPEAQPSEELSLAAAAAEPAKPGPTDGGKVK